ncbi:MAG: hypothetical protein J6R00_00650 [Lentisphaeria bacterium]|nr:hypothetical protein [Lentisphaeria bacterium]
MRDKISPRELQQLKAKVRNWCGSDLCTVFPYITDLHSALETVDPLNSQKRETISDILLLNRIAETLDADFCADLGDTGIDVPVKTPEELEMLTSRCLEYHKSCAVRPVLFACGNHDVKKGYTPEFWGNEFRKINSGCSGMTCASSGEYGFYDPAGKNLRIFWLNCNPVPGHYTFEQCDFVEKHLSDLPSGWCAAIIQHVCLHDAGRWQGTRPTPEVYTRMHNICASFVSNGGAFAGFFTGDSHFNTFACADGVSYYVSQGYGGISPNERPAHAKRSNVLSPALGWEDSFDSSKEFLIDVVAINTAKRKAAVFRAGAGGDDFNTFWEF